MSWLTVYNGTDDNIVSGSMVELYASGSVPYIKKPTEDDIHPCGITCGDIPSKTYGKIVVSDIGIITTSGGYAIGDILGPAEDSYEASDQGNQLLVLFSYGKANKYLVKFLGPGLSKLDVVTSVQCNPDQSLSYTTESVRVIKVAE